MARSSKRKAAAAPPASGRSSILAYIKAPSSPVDTNLDDQVSDTIAVMDPSFKIGASNPLDAAPSESGPPTKKQRLYLESVKITVPPSAPVVNTPALSISSTAPTTPAPAQDSSEDERAASSDDGISVGLSTPPQLPTISTFSDETSDDGFAVAMSTPQLEDISTTDKPGKSNRPRRSTATTRSYLEIADSEEELATDKPRKSRKINGHDLDDDFDQDSHHVSEDDVDESLGHPTDDEDESRVDAQSSDRETATVDVKTSAPAKKTKRRKIDGVRMKNLRDAKASKTGVHYDLPPLSTIPDIFVDLTSNAVKLGLDKVCSDLDSRTIRVATMCSGTESPLLALRSISEGLSASGHTEFTIEHVFSAEIEPYKQAFIERNFGPPLILKDIVEITNSKDGTATTAYGGNAIIPGELDLLIAGTACVDFSGLNRKKKGLDANGESGDTFAAVLDYAVKYRPRVVILENILNAPWMDMLDYYENIDYSARGGLFDSKEYYLPQTRQRGYMICVDRQNTKLSKEEADKMCAEWQQIMVKMKRAVSSSVSDFLTPNDDRQVILSRDRIAREVALDPAIRVVDWSKCEERHRIFRLNNKLGYAKPYTSWEPSGTLSLFDYVDQRFQKAQVERIWDYEDCAILRKARNYDASFKRKIWDLSQNIDRFTDTAQFGIAPCLTPTGIFYLADAGRPLTFAESLGLQGLPADKLHFTSETERQVQDLAGNAMTSTVVGSAIVAALIAAKEVLQAAPTRTASVQPVTRKKASTIAGLEKLVPVASSVSGAVNIDVAQMIDHAVASTSLCYCEGQISSSNKPIQRCVDCNHTTCIQCGGKPLHNYMPERSVRQTPQSFIQKWRNQLPMRLLLKHDLKDLELLFDKEFESQLKKAEASVEELVVRYRKRVRDVVSGDFSFNSFKRSSCWTIVYESTNAQLKLVIDAAGINWELFGLPEPSWAGNDPLRKFLELPIARAHGHGELLGGTWQWRVPQMIDFELQMTARGSEVPAWTARLHLPGEEHKTMPEAIDISFGAGSLPELDGSIIGTYEHLRNCGTACEALYKRRDSVGAPMFLFLDPAPIGPGKNDGFVFSTNPERLQNDERRHVAASLNVRWRPWRSWVDRVSKAKGVTDSRWINDSTTSIIRGESSLQTFAHLDGLAVAAHTHCSESVALASCTFPAEAVSNRHINQQQIKPGDKAFFRTFAWAFEALRGHVAFEQAFTVAFAQARECATCAPPLPEIKWIHNGRLNQLRPQEDSQSATHYEVARKRRPNVFTVESAVDQARMNIKIGINGVALAQRAFAKLSKMTSSGFHPTSWTIDTQFSELSLHIPTFRINPNDPQVSANVNLPSGVQLWEKQKQTLGWMREQEAGRGKEIILEAAAEALLPHLGWRAEARATASQFVRGGILADHPGFGKTITSLSLIYSEFLGHDDAKDKNAAIIEKMGDSTHGPADAACPIKIAATLIICPSTIAKQWYGEVEKVLGKQYQDTTLLIDNFSKFTKCSIDQFKAARIIILDPAVLACKGYLARVAEISGLPPYVGDFGRDFRAWLHAAVEKIPQHSHILLNQGATALIAQVNTTIEQRLQNTTYKQFATKRLKGAAYAKKHATTEDRKKVPSDAELRGAFMTPPAKVKSEPKKYILFEMFHFNRIIVDEFTYMFDSKSGAMTSITTLQADKRWGLSATPPLKDAYDVAQLARVVGIKLSNGFGAPGLLAPKHLTALQKDLTNVELLELSEESPTHALLDRVHRSAQNFLDDFVRQNIQRYDDFPYSDHIVPITLRLDHGIAYEELSHRLNSQDMRIKRGNKQAADGLHSEEGVNEAISGVHQAEQALSTKAAFLVLQKKEDLLVVEDGQSGLQALLDKRLGQLKQHETELESAIQGCQRLNRGLDAQNNHFERWQEDVLEANRLGDEYVTERIRDKIFDVTGIRFVPRIPEPSQEEPSQEELSQEELSQEESTQEEPSQKKSSRKKSSQKKKKPSGKQKKPSGKQKKPSGKQKKKKDDDDEEEDGEGDGNRSNDEDDNLSQEAIDMKQAAGRLNKAAIKVLASTRSVRFVKNTQEIGSLMHQKESHTLRKCGFESCAGDCDLNTVSVSSLCGHIICEPCFGDSQKDVGKCGFPGCSANVQSFNLLPAHKMGTLPPPSSTSTKQGEKVSTVIKMLQRIRRLKQQAILFVRTDKDAEAMVKVLTANDISFCEGHGIAGFQSETDPAKKKTVIVLCADAESAAGANLTNANHAIFLSPLLKENSYGYDSQMAQAVGRIRRPGQKNRVFVYRMMALHTVDVDILEQRERNDRILTEIRPNEITGRSKPAQPDADVEMLDAGVVVDSAFKGDEMTSVDERMQLIRDKDARFKLVPKGLLLERKECKNKEEVDVLGPAKVKGFESFNGLIKFSKAYADV